MRPAAAAGDSGAPDGLAVGRGLQHAVILQHVEHGRVVRGDAVDALRQQMRPELVRNGLADEPEGVLGQPAVRGLGLVELEFFLEQVAQALEQLALQGVLGCGHGAGRVAAQGLGHGGAVGLDDEFAQCAGMFVLPGQDVEQRCPQRWVSAEPVQDAAIEHLAIEQAGGRTMQAVLAVVAVAEPVRAGQWPVPGVPCAAIGVLHMEVHGDLADVVQQCRIGNRGCPRFGLGGLVLRGCAGRQQMGLAQFQCERGDFQSMVEHAAGVGVVVALRCGELLHQLGVALQRCAVQGGELLAR